MVPYSETEGQEAGPDDSEIGRGPDAVDLPRPALVGRDRGGVAEAADRVVHVEARG